MSTARDPAAIAPGVWRWPPAAAKAHWFRSGQARSACGGWTYTGPPTETQYSSRELPGPQDCRACWRAAAAAAP